MNLGEGTRGFHFCTRKEREDLFIQDLTLNSNSRTRAAVGNGEKKDRTTTQLFDEEDLGEGATVINTALQGY